MFSNIFTDLITARGCDTPTTGFATVAARYCLLLDDFKSGVLDKNPRNSKGAVDTGTLDMIYDCARVFNTLPFDFTENETAILHSLVHPDIANIDDLDEMVFKFAQYTTMYVPFVKALFETSDRAFSYVYHGAASWFVKKHVMGLPHTLDKGEITYTGVDNLISMARSFERDMNSFSKLYMKFFPGLESPYIWALDHISLPEHQKYIDMAKNFVTDDSAARAALIEVLIDRPNFLYDYGLISSGAKFVLSYPAAAKLLIDWRRFPKDKFHTMKLFDVESD